LAEAGDIALSLDLRGLKCPLPVLKTRKAMMALTSGAQVATTDPLAGIDIPHFCQEDGHVLISQTKSAAGHIFVIRKG
jgi:tRNA 2-thiouridine synthesizing protein A